MVKYGVILFFYYIFIEWVEHRIYEKESELFLNFKRKGFHEDASYEYELGTLCYVIDSVLFK